MAKTPTHQDVSILDPNQPVSIFRQKFLKSGNDTCLTRSRKGQIFQQSLIIGSTTLKSSSKSGKICE
jgi:hypothetical protein